MGLNEDPFHSRVAVRSWLSRVSHRINSVEGYRGEGCPALEVRLKSPCRWCSVSTPVQHKIVIVEVEIFAPITIATDGPSETGNKFVNVMRAQTIALL